jgi:hypothetical protein
MPLAISSVPPGGGSRLPGAERPNAVKATATTHVASRSPRVLLPIVELELPSAARRHAAAIGTFANRRNQYVPIGNLTVAPSCQPARAAA